MILARAAFTAPWWELVLQAIFLLSFIGVFTGWFILPTIRFIWKLVGAISHPVKEQREIQQEHRDPTRPRSWEDQAAYVYVSERMRQFEHKSLPKKT